MGTFDFVIALTYLKDGVRVARRGWNGKGMWIRIPPPYHVSPGPGAEGIYTSRQFIEMKAADGTFVPWVASQTDLLAEDWEVVTP